METKQWTVADIPDGSDALCGAHTAQDYYGGQFTALYAMSSSGSLELRKGDGLAPIIREVEQAIRDAHDNGNDTDAYDMGQFLDWLKTNERETSE